MQPASSSLDQPQVGSGQSQPTGNDQTPTPTRFPVQPAGNDFATSAGANANSDAIAEAQLTHFVSRDDAVQGQNAPDVPDTPMPDAPTVHDIGASVHSLPQVSASVLCLQCVWDTIQSW